jgi:hypothetical protein
MYTVIILPVFIMCVKLCLSHLREEQKTEDVPESGAEEDVET